MPNNKQTCKVCFKWVREMSPDEFRVRMQVISDIYKAIQTRLDGYRQKAGAAFLAVLVYTLAFDSTVVRFFQDNINNNNRQIYNVVLGFSAIFIITIYFITFLIIKSIGRDFAEMTSIIFKIDHANEVFTEGVWLENDALYPPKFGKGVDVRRSETDPPLSGWTDPAISLYQHSVVITGILNLVFFLVLYFSFR